MRRSFVPIYQDKKYNNHIYFDYVKNEFFTTPQGKISGIVYMSGFAGIMFYSYFKDVTFNTGLKPFTIVLLCLLLGAIIGFASIKLIMNAINKRLDEKKVVLTHTREQLYEYICEGRKQFRAQLLMILFLLFFNMLCSILLLFMPYSVLFMIINIMMWPIVIIMTWGVRPIKRREIINQLLNGAHNESLETGKNA